MTHANPIARRAVLMGILALSACGDDEPAQRRAFIAFLQTRILDKPGLRVPTPTADEAKSWGDYAKHYAVITAFNSELSARVSKPMQDAMAKGAIRSLDDLLTRRGEVEQLKAAVQAFSGELDRQFATAEAARAGLSQPADLQPVYAAAYERTVAAPARAFKEMFPTVNTALAAALDVAGFVAQNRSVITTQGINLQVSDPRVMRDLNARVEAMRAEQAKVLDAQRRVAALISGQ